MTDGKTREKKRFAGYTPALVCVPTCLMLTYTCLEGTAIQRRRPSSNKPWTVPFVPGRSFLRWMIGFSCASLFALNLLFFFILSFFMTDDPLRSRAVLHWGLPGKVGKKTVVHGSAWIWTRIENCSSGMLLIMVLPNGCLLSEGIFDLCDPVNMQRSW